MNRNDFYEEYDFDSHENKVRIAAVIGTLAVSYTHLTLPTNSLV